MDNQAVLFCNTTATEMLNIHTNPGHDTRRFAMLHIAIHDAINSIESRYKCYNDLPPIPQQKEANVEAAIYSAAQQVLLWAIDDIRKYNLKLKNDNLQLIKFDTFNVWTVEINRRFKAKINYLRISATTRSQSLRIDNGVTIGKNAAIAIINWSKSDINFTNLNIRTYTPADSHDLGKFHADVPGTSPNSIDYYTIPPPLAKNRLMVGFGDVQPFVIPYQDYGKQLLPNFYNYNKVDVDVEGNMVHVTGLYGHSFGGYETNFIISQTNIFAAAVSGAGVSDIISMYFNISRNAYFQTDMWRFENQQFRIGKSLYDDKEAYVSNSPIMHAENVKTPLLLWAGKNDRIIPWNQSITYYLALRKLGVITEMLVYPDEDHSLEKPDNQKDLSRRMMAWFDHLLKGDPELKTSAE